MKPKLGEGGHSSVGSRGVSWETWLCAENTKGLLQPEPCPLLPESGEGGLSTVVLLFVFIFP